MKKIICTLFLFVCVSITAQSNNDSMLSDPPSFVSSKKDTLYLVNDNLGKSIAGSWEGQYYQPERDGKKPCIVFVNQQYIMKRHKMVLMSSTKNKSTQNKNIAQKKELRK